MSVCVSRRARPVRWRGPAAATLLAFLALGACDSTATDPPITDATPSDVGPDITVDMGPDPADVGSQDADLPDAEPLDADISPPDAFVVPPGPEGTTAVLVRLDGAPAVGAVVTQGGVAGQWPVDDRGWAHLPIDLEVEGEIKVVGSHPQARQRAEWAEDGEPVILDLVAFNDADNPEYRFQDPGAPGRRETTAQCGHCHLTINDGWFASAHRGAASNPTVQDMYAGAAAALDTAARCAEAGGRWRRGRLPGGGEGDRCYLGAGLLPVANPECADGPCPDPTETGHCADCHAPGQNGQLGGRDLLDAKELAYSEGVFCDVCHRVSDVDFDAEAPGVGGALRLMRPSEPGSFTLGAGGLLPLTFGPSHDSPNPRMGSVQRDHYRDGRLCGGCHQYTAGDLPVHSTWQEWSDGPFADEAFCPDCHMPPAAEVANSADLQAFPFADVGQSGGWLRPPGAVRRHTWTGPRSEDGRLLHAAASVQIQLTPGADAVEAAVTVRNVAAGHRIPTGEPMRALLLHVEAWCDDAPAPALGGDALPAWAGADAALEVEDPAALPAAIWPEAWGEPRVGDQLRVVWLTGEHHDYDGFGAFGADTPAAEKGLPVERVVGARLVTAVAPLAFDAPIPEGHRAYLIRAEDEAGAAAPALAGAPGFAFARVTVDAEGREMVPHFTATGLASDNRLAPQQAWSSRHRFPACPDLRVQAQLIHRPHPRALALERRWAAADRVMTTTLASLSPPEAVTPPSPEAGELIEVDLQAAATADGGYAYNDGLPVIRGRVGDRLVATLTNALDAPTTVHWHGVKVPVEMDGTPRTQAPVQPGERFTYDFQLTHPGTFWFHPHFDTEGQVDRGLYGVLLVDPPELPPPSPETYDELVLVLDAEDEARPADEAGDRSAPGPAHGHGRLVTRWQVNGAPAPLAYVAPDRPVRVRVVNASNTGYLALRWPEMRHIEGQQGFLAGLETPTSLVIPPGGRAGFEWLVSSPFTVETLPYSLNGGPALGDPTPLVTVSPASPDQQPSGFAWPWTMQAPQPDPGHTDGVLSFGGSDRTGRWRINGERFPEVTPVPLVLGAGAVLEIRNVSPTRHPFHLHGLHFEVLSVDGLPPASPVWADTIDVGVYSTIRLWVPVDNPGAWMAHCHILPHAEDGMMTFVLAE